MEMTGRDIDYEGLLKRALKNGGDFSELFVEHRRGTSVSSEAKRIEKYLESEESGAGLRVVVGDRQAYAYTNDFSSLNELADTVASAVRKGAFDARRTKMVFRMVIEYCRKRVLLVPLGRFRYTTGISLMRRLSRCA